MGDVQLMNGDLVISAYGDLSVLDGNNEILQGAINNIYTIFGEMENHPDIGNALFNKRIKFSDVDLVLVEDGCKVAILQDRRVDRVISISAIRSLEVYGQCDIVFVIQTINGDIMDSRISINI